MVTYSFLKEARINTDAIKKGLIATGVGLAGIGGGGVAGHAIGNLTYKKPDDEVIFTEHENEKQEVINRINSLNAELNQLINYRRQLEVSDPEATLVPIQKINKKIEMIQFQRNMAKAYLQKLELTTDAEVIRNHKKSHVAKRRSIGAAIGLAAALGGKKLMHKK